jgi:hypothetical protein
MRDVTEVLQAKKRLLEKLLSTIKQATRLLEEDDIDGFDRELLNCEQIMKKVDELGSVGQAASENVAAAETEKEIERLLEQIDEANKKCRDLSEEKLKGLGKQIKTLRNKKQGINSYNQTSRAAVFIDAKK